MTTMLTLDTPRFGTIEYCADDVVRFAEGVLGFPNLHSYLILEHKPGSKFRWLQSIEDSNLSFLVADPNEFVSNYDLEINDQSAETLHLTAETLVLVYTIVTIPRGAPDQLTLNLAGPIVINAVTREAKQFVIENPVFGVKHKPDIRSSKSEEENAA